MAFAHKKRKYMEDETTSDWKTKQDFNSAPNILDESMSDWKTHVDEVKGMGEIDRYILEKPLGAGAFGEVFLAKDSVSGVDVAIKLLPPLLSAVPEELENVRANFAIVNKLKHPNIAALEYIHKVEKTNVDKKVLRVFEGSYIVVMEFVEGSTLSNWKKQFKDKKVSFEKAIDICAKVANALDYAHSKKVVHRDVKPSNIMVAPDGDVKVLDFGLAAEIKSSMSRVSQKQGDTSGTRPYMAPEQWSGKKQKAQTDQYAIAVMFYELISGEVPFQSVFETNDTILMMNLIKSEMPEELEELTSNQNKTLMQGLAKTADERFTTCEEFINAVNKSEEVAELARKKEKERLAEIAQKKKNKIIVFAVLAIVLIIGIWYAGFQPAKSQQDAGAPRNTDKQHIEELAKIETEKIALKKEKERLAELERKIEENRLAEVARKEKEARLAEIARKEKEARLAEIARKEKEARLAEIARKKEENVVFYSDGVWNLIIKMAINMSGIG